MKRRLDEPTPGPPPGQLVEKEDASEVNQYIPKSVLGEFSKTVEQILQEWHFPGATDVYFDEGKRDVVIGDRLRGRGSHQEDFGTAGTGSPAIPLRTMQAMKLEKGTLIFSDTRLFESIHVSVAITQRDDRPGTDNAELQQDDDRRAGSRQKF